MTILNAFTKKSGNLLKPPRHIYIYLYISFYVRLNLLYPDERKHNVYIKDNTAFYSPHISCGMKPAVQVT